MILNHSHQFGLWDNLTITFYTCDRPHRRCISVNDCHLHRGGQHVGIGTLDMGYDNMHRITSKRQYPTQDNVLFNGTLNAGNNLSYSTARNLQCKRSRKTE